MKAFLETILLNVVAVALVAGFFIMVAKAEASPTRIEKAANLAGAINGIDPDLVMAIIEVESHFNPKAVGGKGERGLMQLRPQFFPDASFNIERNIFQGVAHLAVVRERCAHKQDLTWVTCFNGGTSRYLKDPTANVYYQRVMNAYLRRVGATARAKNY